MSMNVPSLPGVTPIKRYHPTEERHAPLLCIFDRCDLASDREDIEPYTRP